MFFYQRVNGVVKMFFKKWFSKKVKQSSQLEYGFSLEYVLDNTQYEKLIDFIKSCQLKRTDWPHDLPNNHFYAHDFYQSIKYKCDSKTHEHIQTFFKTLPVMSDDQVEWAERIHDELLSSGVTCSYNFNIKG
jgi:hypothetical protein